MGKALEALLPEGVRETAMWPRLHFSRITDTLGEGSGLEAVQETVVTGRCVRVGTGKQSQGELCLSIVEESPYKVYRFPRQYMN